MRAIGIALTCGVVAVAIAALFILLGAFDVAADVPHSGFVLAAIQFARDRSIAVRVNEIRVPPLDDPQSITVGAGHYAEMCVGCHLSPERKTSELREGLYPKPPDLTAGIHATPAEEFWAIKHGIKMSAMPAWGATHDDQTIWAIVAFLQALPGLSPERYRELTGAAMESHPHHHHDQHRESGERMPANHDHT
jgi:mono/diheme cytochrome c family protein